MRASRCTDEANTAIKDMFVYHEWDEEKKAHGNVVRAALENAVRAVIEHVPPSADRSTAIRKIREARMDCNSAITHAGRY